MLAPPLDHERRELIAQAAEVLARFGLMVPADAPSVPEFLRHIITAACTHGALRERAAAPRKQRERQQEQKQKGGGRDVDNTVHLSAVLFDPEDWVSLPE